ncbi:MAG: hypothetical protein AAF456_00350 [Planctomycetota bacterium]
MPHSKPASFRRKTLVAWLTVISAALVVLGGAVRVVTYQVLNDPEGKTARLLSRFDLGMEPSIPNWWSSLLWLLNAGVAMCCLKILERSNNRQRQMFGLLAILFVILALDEAVMIHELADATLQGWLNTGGLLYFAWVIPGAIFALACAAAFGKFVFELPPVVRNKIFVSGAVFVSGAIGVELLEGPLYESGNSESVMFTVFQCIEEGLEMLGIILCIDALLHFLHLKNARLDVEFL